jgi:glycosyltransferase involved in cell wall biosynthesis
MNDRPLVTIGMCVKNGETYIKEAIESVINQDFWHELMEIILVDDGSTDRTLSIIREAVSDIDIKTKIFHHEWKGLGYSRNVVVNNADGKYIVWVDYDNLLFEDHVRKQVRFMEQNPKIGIATGIFRSRPETNIISTLESIEWEVAYFQMENKMVNSTVGHFCGGGGGSIYRVEAIRQAGAYDANITGAGEDYDAERRMTKKGWLLYTGTEAEFYHRCKKTWKALWRETFWYGYGGHYLSHRKIKPVAPNFALTRLKFFLFIGYKLTRRKVAFLFPVQQAFKKMAWLFGFGGAHLDGYGH